MKPLSPPPDFKRKLKFTPGPPPPLAKDRKVVAAPPKPAPKGKTRSLEEIYQHLKEIRVKQDVTLKPCPLLKTHIKGLDGRMTEFKMRYYQVIGTYHLITMSRMVLGDNCGLGKTIEAIAALCYGWMLNKDQRVLVVAPKSVTEQWANEIRRFTNGVTPYVVTNTRSKIPPTEHRKAIYDKWLHHEGPAVLILNYDILVRDWNAEAFQPLLPNGRPDPKKPVIPGILDGVTSLAAYNLTVIFDEAAAFKNMSSKRWEICRLLSDKSKRVWGLTATLLKNRLEEGYSIYKCIRPQTFTTKQAFLDTYCYYTKKQVGKARINIVTGYKNLQGFRDVIDPFFLARQKHEVSTELPALTTREITFPLNQAEDSKYAEALSGLLELGSGDFKDYTETRALTAIGYCQQICNSLSMLKYEEGQDIGIQGFDLDRKAFMVGAVSTKEQYLLDLLEGELEGEKVVVYTRFASIVPRLQELLKKQGIASVRITGKDREEVREASKKAFQDPDSKIQIIIITDAANEGVNLQSAAAMVFFDAPWSWGNYVQVLGRMIRIGSPHQNVVAYHLVSTRANGSMALDGQVLKMLRKKKDVIDKVIGEAAVGALEFESKNDLRSLLEALQAAEGNLEPTDD